MKAERMGEIALLFLRNNLRQTLAKGEFTETTASIHVRREAEKIGIPPLDAETFASEIVKDLGLKESHGYSW